jgi:serine/threonine protein kinase
LVDLETGKLKRVDFGSRNIFKEEAYTDFDGTRVYASPEWILDESYFGCSKYYGPSLGVILYDMVCGDIPWKKDHQICRGSLLFTRKLSSECQDLLKRCLRENTNPGYIETSLDEENSWNMT